MKRLLKWVGIGLLVLIIVVTTPILYIETMCRGSEIAQADARYITEDAQQRPEARTYMVYPEWHIVYAYEGYAEALKSGPPHRFPFLSSVTGFWSSLCGLTAKADELGEAGFDSKATIYTIGASFTLEMLFKAAYEESLGRVFSLFGDSPQDNLEAEMAQDYATFLQQVPWYKYDFDAWTSRLWTEAVGGARGLERRLALTLEWKAKAAYAKLIAKAAEGLGADKLTMQIAYRADNAVVAEGLTPISSSGDVSIAEVPRYRVFTRIAQELAQQGTDILEIAGNDDVLVSLISDGTPELPEMAQLISQTDRPGFSDHRHLVSVKTTDLTALIRALPTDLRLEHIYDY